MTAPPPNPAGWYPAMDTPGHERWWDGNQWTPATRPVPPAPFVPLDRPERSTGRTWFIGLTVVGLIAVVFVLFSGGGSSDNGGGSGTGGKTYSVTYQVDGASSADLTMTTANGGTSQQQAVSLPIKNQNGGDGLSLTVHKGAFVYIAAQNNGSGTITCHILIDGVEVITNSSSGEFAIATCSGRV